MVELTGVEVKDVLTPKKVVAGTRAAGQGGKYRGARSRIIRHPLPPVPLPIEEMQGVESTFPPAFSMPPPMFRTGCCILLRWGVGGG
eukprot:184513-Hanusia_phi.AAC.2